MNVEWYMAARARIVYQGQHTLTGALLAKPDNDGVVLAVEDTFDLYYGNKAMSPLDAIEHQVAKLVDAGSVLPVSNPEAFMAAKWISQEGLDTLPNPMPRAFVLYIAKALCETGQIATMEEALTEILTTKTFA